MGKRTVPRGATKKQPCDVCGRLFYAYLSQTGKLITTCQVCKPPEEKKR